MTRNTNRYDDMLHLPHHVSTTRPPMSRLNRAAQFAPFDALNGYSAAIQETARQTQDKAELDDSAKLRLNRKLQQLLRMPGHPEITVLWFQPDCRKSGGTYRTSTGQLRKIDPFRRVLLLEDGTVIPIEDIRRLICDRFSGLDDLA